MQDIDNATRMTLFDSGGNTVFDAEAKIHINMKTSLKKNIEKNKSQSLALSSIFVSKYIIKKILGQGSFGISYLAEEEGSGNKVVIKEFFPKNLASRSLNGTEVFTINSSDENSTNIYNKMKEIFEEEARNLVLVNTKQHKNVVGFVSLEKNVNNTVYFLMNYSEGIDFKDYLKENQNLSQKDILKIIIPVLNGLAHIHHFNVYHKDVKPENIYLRKNDEPMLIDFGASVTSAHLLTPSYAPIEQVNRMQSDYGPYTDLYSVGVMLYTIVTNGAMPPKSKLRAEAISRGEKDPYKKLISQRKEFSVKYDLFFLKAIDHSLKLSYQDRPQNSKEFKSELVGNANKKKQMLIITSIISILLIVIFLLIVFKPKYGHINIITNEEGVGVLINNVAVKSERPNLYKTKIGKHNIEIFKKGFISIKEKVRVKDGEQKIIRKDLFPDKIMVQVKTNNKIDANIYINNELRARAFSPIDIRYNIKPFSFIAKKDGYEHSKKKIFTYKNLLKNREISLELRKIEGSINFKNPIGAYIYINGELVKNKRGIPVKTPFKIKKRPGRYTIKIRKNKKKYKILTKTISIKDKIITSVDEVLEPIKKKNKKEKKNKIKEALNKIREVKKKQGVKKKIKEILIEPKEPIIISIKKIKFSETEVTYNELVRFLNSMQLSYSILRKYFFINSKRVSNYIKREDINGTTNYYVIKGYENYPVVNISWSGAKAYTDWLSEMLGKEYRLPRVEEWEEIASIKFNPLLLDDLANHNENSYYNEVKSKIADSSKLYDVFGNVSEWCENPEGNYSRAIRGGSYKTNKRFMSPLMNNIMNENSTRNNDLGFRIAED